MAFKREMDFNQLYALEYIFLSALEQEKTLALSPVPARAEDV
jgi:hypothetical protein